MRLRLFALALALFTVRAAAAATYTLTFEPAQPTLADTVVAVVTSSEQDCPALDPEYMKFTGSEIRLVLDHDIDCGFAPHGTARVTLGRLPPGSYPVSLLWTVPSPPSTADQELLVVSVPPYDSSFTRESSLENLTGHWIVPNAPGQGVFVQHFGKTAFVSILTYGADGKPTWWVMPEAHYRHNSALGRMEFAGDVYETLQAGAPGGEIAAVPIGTGTLTGSIETGTLELSTSRVTATYALRRFRF